MPMDDASNGFDVSALVIERNVESARLVQALLEPWRIAVIHTSSTAEAQLMVIAVRPEIVLCDLSPSHADALRFIEWLRSSPDSGLRGIPAIAMTAAYEDIDARTVRRAGFDVFLRKPIDPDQLPHVVALLLAQARAGRGDGHAERGGPGRDEDELTRT